MKKKWKEIESELDEFYKRTGQGRLEQLEILQTIQRPYSTVTFLQARTLSRTNPLVMKTVKHHPINRIFTEQENQAVVEFRTLQELYPKFQGVEGCFVPRPVIVVPEMETYVMDFVKGSLLMDNFRYTRVFSSLVDFRKLRDHMFWCGRWLKHFQQFTGINLADRSALTGVIERAEYRLGLIESRMGKHCPQDLRRRVRQLFNEQLDELSGEVILTCGRHGDFTPLNMIAGAKGITVIDFFGYDRDPVPVDVLKILVFLEDEARSLTCSVRRVEELKAAFLQGYGRLYFSLKPVVLICEAMHRINCILGAMVNLKPKFHHHLEARLCARAHIRWLTKLTNRIERRPLWPSCSAT